MKKTLGILFTFFLLISCSNDDENIFKTKKVVFKEKKDQLLYFKDKKQVELNEDAKTFYYKETEKNNGDNEDNQNIYFIFESETKFKLIGFFDEKEDEEKSWNYKFENGLLKIEYKGKYFPVCVGNSPNKLTIIIDSFLSHKETIDGSSTSSGTLGSGDVVPTRAPLSFELAIKFLDYEKIEDIDGNDYLYLQREEIIFE